MKIIILITTSLLVSLSAIANSQSSEKRTFNYSGRIAKMIVSALKSADVKAKCNKNTCKYIISDFYAAEETDGCGGGTTSYDTSFTYPDSTKYSFRYCEGYDGRDFQDKNNRASALVTIVGELDFFRTSGWTSSASLEKIECITEQDESYAGCTVVSKY